MATRYQNLLVPHDFSSHAQRALEVAMDLAIQLEGQLHLVHALQPPTFAVPVTGMGMTTTAARPVVDMGAWEREAEEQLESIVKQVSSLPGSVATHVISAGTPAESICTVAEQMDADMIIMGTHGRTGLAHVFLGSVAERTMRNAPCPVLTVRSSEEDESKVRSSEGDES